MGRLAIKAILLGGIADVVASNILSIPLMVHLASGIDLAHMAKDQAQAALLAALHASPALLAVQVLLGIACSVLGGYVAARIAGHDETLHGALSAWLCVGLGLYGVAFGRTQSGVLMTLAEFIGAPLAGMLGGVLWCKQWRAANLAPPPQDSPS